MAAKSRFVGVRLAPEQQHKLVLMSLATDEPGNISAGLRWAIDNAQVHVSQVSAQGAGAVATKQHDPEVQHA